MYAKTSATRTPYAVRMTRMVDFSRFLRAMYVVPVAFFNEASLKNREQKIKKSEKTGLSASSRGNNSPHHDDGNEDCRLRLLCVGV